LSGLAITALTTGTTTINVAANISKMQSTITQFVTDYNAVQSQVATETSTKVDSQGNLTASPLSGDNLANDISSTLRKDADAAPRGSPIMSLEDLGVVSNGNDNTLSIPDTTTLTDALTNNLAAVQDLFQNSTYGIGTTLNTYVTNITGTNGALTTAQGDLTTQSQSIDTTISTLETKVTNDETQWTTEFENMETAESSYNTDKEYLNAYFNSSSSSSG
jgi:flagellar hook-associated protein 2